MKRYLILFLLVLVQHSYAATPNELLNEANEAYKRSEYSYAVELYEQILEEGLVSADLYYNLGNAYYKNNMIGPAILNYERALRLRPSDEDTAHNLALARSRIVDRLDQRPELFYDRWWRAAVSLQGSDGWAITSIILIIAFLGVTSVYLFSRTVILKKVSFYVMLLVFASGALSLIFAQKQYNRLTSEKEAIIMQTRVTAKSSPSAQSPDLFLMHEGTRVNIRNTLGDWKEISLPNGNIGWIRKESIEII
ncbi:MAG: tetratricopeptide repeat protein [Bacteroidetes bacterium]|nr:MAG: tetratricopeptide repeat protein [Bacteroidota bacterium]